MDNVIKVVFNFIQIIRMFQLSFTFTYICDIAAEEQDQREGDGRPKPGRGVCPSCSGFLREPL